LPVSARREAGFRDAAVGLSLLHAVVSAAVASVMAAAARRIARRARGEELMVDNMYERAPTREKYVSCVQLQHERDGRGYDLTVVTIGICGG
jgi:hypothetical protein